MARKKKKTEQKENQGNDEAVHKGSLLSGKSVVKMYNHSECDNVTDPHLVMKTEVTYIMEGHQSEKETDKWQHN